MSNTPDCKECGGQCCKIITLTTEKMGYRMLEWAKVRGTVIGGKWFIKSVCKWFHAGRCSHHATKPEVCKTFDPGCESCMAARRLYGIK